MDFKKIFNFMDDLAFVALEWNLKSKELTGFIPNKKCDVHGEAGLEPFGDSEYIIGSFSRNAFLEMTDLLTKTKIPDFYIKSPIVRYTSESFRNY